MRMATRTIVWISVLAMLPFATAGAQQGAALEIDEVIVTARKRAESLQEVPIAITVFTAQTIERAGIERPARRRRERRRYAGQYSRHRLHERRRVNVCVCRGWRIEHQSEQLQ